MKMTLIIGFLVLGLNVFSQNDTLLTKDLEHEVILLSTSIQSLQLENNKLNKEISRINARILSADVAIDSLVKKTEINTNAINKAETKLGLKISNTETNANQKIENVNNSLIDVSSSLGNKFIYALVGIIMVTLLVGIIYYLLRKKQNLDNSSIIEQLSKTKLSIEESLIKEFNKQTELMDTLGQKLKMNNLEANDKAEPEHSLALKLASEINLIERNINLMDVGTKGLKQLIRSVEKLKDNLAANGYEIPELLGKKYHQGMNVIVITSIPDENLQQEEEIITKILIPQVNYNDKMIQPAQIEVSVGI